MLDRVLDLVGETSTVRRTRFSPRFSTAVGIGPFNQPRVGSGPMERYDVVVVGVGGMGSAALYHLARRGKRVLGLERFDLLHEQGSRTGSRGSSGSRTSSTPTTCRSFAARTSCWRELEAEAGEQLLRITGNRRGRRPDLRGRAPLVRRARPPARGSGRAEVARRFPALRLPSRAAGRYQPDGGFVSACARSCRGAGRPDGRCSRGHFIDPWMSCMRYVRPARARGGSPSAARAASPDRGPRRTSRRTRTRRAPRPRRTC